MRPDILQCFDLPNKARCRNFIVCNFAREINRWATLGENIRCTLDCDCWNQNKTWWHFVNLCLTKNLKVHKMAHLHLCTNLILLLNAPSSAVETVLKKKEKFSSNSFCLNQNLECISYRIGLCFARIIIESLYSSQNNTDRFLELRSRMQKKIYIFWIRHPLHTLMSWAKHSTI